MLIGGGVSKSEYHVILFVWNISRAPDRCKQINIKIPTVLCVPPPSPLLLSPVHRCGRTTYILYIYRVSHIFYFFWGVQVLLCFGASVCTSGAVFDGRVQLISPLTAAQVKTVISARVSGQIICAAPPRPPSHPMSVDSNGGCGCPPPAPPTTTPGPL